MTATPGRCPDMTHCATGRRGRLVRVELGAAFVCPGCGTGLIASERRHALLAVAAIGGAAMIAGGFYCMGLSFTIGGPAAPPPARHPVLASAQRVATPALSPEAARLAALARAAAAPPPPAPAMVASPPTDSVNLQRQFEAVAERLQQDQPQDDETPPPPPNAVQGVTTPAIPADASQQDLPAVWIGAAPPTPVTSPAVARKAPLAPAPKPGINRPFVAQVVAGGDPAYPSQLADSPRPGHVNVHCLIDTAGLPQNCRVIAARGGHVFSNAVMDWLHSGQVRYAPILKNGHPVAQDQEWVVNFTP